MPTRLPVIAIVGVAIGVAGLPSLQSLVGTPDLFGCAMRVTEVALADEVAAAASLLMGQTDAGLPLVHVRGLTWHAPAPLTELLWTIAVARLVFDPSMNIQASWVKMGANDLGGTLMDESISRAAGAAHGREMTQAAMEALIGAAGRVPRRRTTLYGRAPGPIERRTLAMAPAASLPR